MADPTSAVIGACASLLTSVCIASVLGVDEQAILWAFFGACIGLALAPGQSFARAIGVFVFVTLGCSLGGTLLSHAYHADDRIWRNGYAFALAMGFHPLSATALRLLEPVISAAAERFGVRK